MSAARSDVDVSRNSCCKQAARLRRFRHEAGNVLAATTGGTAETADAVVALADGAHSDLVSNVAEERARQAAAAHDKAAAAVGGAAAGTAAGTAAVVAGGAAAEMGAASIFAATAFSIALLPAAVIAGAAGAGVAYAMSSKNSQAGDAMCAKPCFYEAPGVMASAELQELRRGDYRRDGPTGSRQALEAAIARLMRKVDALIAELEK